METKKRCPNFTSDEKVKLLQLIESQKDTILNKKTDGTTNKAKEDAWLQITNNFNAISSTIRPTDSLKKMWNTLKSTAKTYKAKQRIDVTKTGGGPEEVKTDPILEEVLRFMGRGGVGLSSINDSDKIHSDNLIDLAVHEIQPQGEVEIEEPAKISTPVTTKDSGTPSTQARNEVEVLNVNSAYKSRRRPQLPKESKYNMAKIKAIEADDTRADEIHILQKRKLEQEIEIRDIILKKMRNNEAIDPSWIPLLR
ncbi:hypothetical protein FQR65_LT15667 [Abscondita terminalis]|nr:hypothetical protein FQR65_LT15667 [Abscondita terminalis]